MIAHNLPQHTTLFVGRKVERAEIVHQLCDPHCRLLTIVGPGGIGKTRLAAQVCSDLIEPKSPNRHLFQDGVYFVSLQALISSAFNLSVIADSFHLQFTPDCKPEEQVLSYLRKKSLLLVLDNFEHLLDGVGVIIRLLETAPHLKVLATSRQALNVQEEWLYPLAGMRYPQQGAPQTDDNYGAVQLFAANARRLDPTFALEDSYAGIIRICQSVEGMPLALELAASWVPSLSTSDIASEIERGLDILETRATNVPLRHRTMRAALDTSWNRLPENEQSVFKKLTVFRGGFTREAAEVVAHASRHTLAGLVDKSWLKHEPTGRYHIHELLRQYGEEHLSKDVKEAQQAHHDHSSYFVDFLIKQEELLDGAKPKEALTSIEIELENVRWYWERAVQNTHESDITPVVSVLWKFYDQGNRFQEGEQLFAKAADLIGKKEGALLQGQLLARQGALLNSLDQPHKAEVVLRMSLEILERFDSPHAYAFCLLQLGRLTLQQDNDTSKGRDYVRASLDLFEAVGNLWGVGQALSWLVAAYIRELDFKMAKYYGQQYLNLGMQLNNLPAIADATAQLSYIANQQHSYLEARKLAVQSLDYFQELGIVWGISAGHLGIAQVAYSLADYPDAISHIAQAFRIQAQYHLKRHSLLTVLELAKIWFNQEEFEKAVELMGVHFPIEYNEFREPVLALLSKAETQLPIAVFDVALKRGSNQDFDSAIRNILVEIEREVRPVTTLLTHELTTREWEILNLVARGKSNQAIANELVLTIGSVKWYVSEILSKLDVANRTEAAAKAREMNLLSN